MKNKRTLLLIVTVLAAAGCCSPKAGLPLIGITTELTPGGGSHTGRNYIEAVAMSGAVPVLLPISTDSAAVAAAIQRVDGLIMIGGEDLDPAWYGEETIPEADVEVIPRRDTSDVLYARAALGEGKPILCICRGAQVMNVVLGGSLWQDLPLQQGVHHRNTAHTVSVAKDSRLYKVFGRDSLKVNSFHHQGVKDPAPGISITARSDDGIVEAYEIPGKKLYAVQFHPEAMARSDRSWLDLFKDFVSLCKGE